MGRFEPGNGKAASRTQFHPVRLICSPRRLSGEVSKAPTRLLTEEFYAQNPPLLRQVTNPEIATLLGVSIRTRQHRAGRTETSRDDGELLVLKGYNFDFPHYTQKRCGAKEGVAVLPLV